ncbi:MAG: aminotransferase class V-fold PLP-dependent enzyme [Pseudomonadota bacterium]|nr:aminotransferase class V-fold PLP-dependent enzyme [Pseudomonadota bacterium]
MSKSSFYFGPGPALLPERVHSTLLVDLNDNAFLPCSFIECSHRYPLLYEKLQSIKNHFREVLSIPENFSVLFLSGGARQHYALSLQNLLRDGETCLSLVSGYWSRLASEEQTRLYPSQVKVCNIEQLNDKLTHSQGCFNYLHAVTNETVDGLALPHQQFLHPNIIVDMTSELGFRMIEWKKFGLVYAGLQKSFGVSGMSAVIIRNDLLSYCNKSLPLLHSYGHIYSSHSMLATPNVFAWWVLGLMLDWMDDQGGVSSLAAKQKKRACQLYSILESYPCVAFFQPTHLRSTQNIVFSFSKTELLDKLFANAQDCGILGLQNHKALPSVRINLYHGIDDAAFHALVNFLSEFLNQHAR